ncbi:MAG: NAD-dependent epimerase/dehydratase family protein, partial [Bacteroidota bacterium]
KKVLVTGGAGFIGSACIAEFQKYDVEILVVDDLSFGNREFIDIPDSHFVQMDILEREKLAELVTNFSPDWIVHLAAVHFIPWCNQHPYKSADINIRGTMNVLDAAAQCENLSGVFFASTAAVYPIYDEAVTEDHPTGPLDIYGLSKLTGERLCQEFHLRTQLPTVICRFFNAFGPNETNPHLIPEVAEQINAGARTLRLGNQKPKRDFIHTFDMARAVVALLEQFNAGIDVFNLGRGIEYSVLEIVDAFSRSLGEEVKVETDPAKVRKSDRLHLLADISKLKNFSGWAPRIGIDEGIATLIER